MNQPDFSKIFLDEALDMLEEWDQICQSLVKNVNDKNINSLFRVAHNLKGSSRSVKLTKFSDFMHKIEDVIALIQKSIITLDLKIITLFIKIQFILVDWIHKLKKDSQVIIDLKEIELELIRVAQSKKIEVKPHREKKEFPISALSSSPSEETLRVSLKKIDSLLLVLNEMAVHHSILNHSDPKSSLAKNALNSLNQNFRDLNDYAYGLRMMEFTPLFQRLKRITLDLSETLNKKVDFISIGEDVEFDKSVIEQIKDPLIHIIRNAMDHGIESQNERAKTSKKEVAMIMIHASTTAEGISITVVDDGKGIDTEAVIKTAKKKGLISESTKLTQKEAYQLIFLPGFSTKEEVTDISGRGIGMDVVKQKIDDLEGTLEIESALGKGTTFHIKIPSSISILDALIISIKNQRFAIPIHEIEEIVSIFDNPIAYTQEDGFLNLRGIAIPLEKISDYLFLDVDSNYDFFKRAMVTYKNGIRMAYLIDQVLGHQVIVKRPLLGLMTKIPGFSGCTIFGDGKPGLIVNMNDIREAAHLKWETIKK